MLDLFQTSVWTSASEASPRLALFSAGTSQSPRANTARETFGASGSEAGERVIHLGLALFTICDHPNGLRTIPHSF
jgi:hypothetical protein